MRTRASLDNAQMRRSAPLVDLRAADAGDGVIEAIVSVFNVVDSYWTRVKPGAFAASLAKRLPVGCWCHDWTAPVAKTLEARELLAGDMALPESIRALGGLYIKGQFNLETTRGKDAYSDVKNGLLNEFSIGFRVKRWSWEEDDPEEADNIEEADLYEWSPVVAGANPLTELISVRELAPAAMPLDEHSETVRAAVEGLTTRLREVAELRISERGHLSDSARTRLAFHRDAYRAAADSLDAWLIDPTPDPDEGRASRLAHLYEQELALAVQETTTCYRH